jgi:hypothetical protein
MLFVQQLLLLLLLPPSVGLFSSLSVLGPLYSPQPTSPPLPSIASSSLFTVLLL